MNVAAKGSCEIVIKLGGRALQSALDRPDFFLPLKKLAGRAVVLHGGGAEINEWAKRFGIESEFVKGQRVTSPALMEIVQAVLCGALNPKLVWRLESLGLSAVGFSGVSGTLLACEVENPELGLVGRVSRVNGELLDEQLRANRIPVIAPIGKLQPSGERCNVNADLAACAVAGQIKSPRLLFLTDQKGILDAAGKKIDLLTLQGLEELEQSGVIKGGMFVKSRAVKDYLNLCPAGQVIICSGMDANSLAEVLDNPAVGTIIKGH